MWTEECVLASRNLPVGCVLLEQVAVVFPTTPAELTNGLSHTHTHVLQEKSESLREAGQRCLLLLQRLH